MRVVVKSAGVRSAVLAVLIVTMPGPTRAKTLCTIVSDGVDGKVLLERGDCRTRVTPASTFKIPLAVMGFDSGFLKDAHSPVFPFKEGYPDWGGENWKQPTDPTRWLKYSVVWYSQLVTHQLGEPKLTAYASAFGFGNADFSGDPGKTNGLDRAWIMSSLKVSPLEQVTFLRKLVDRQLPVSPGAMDETLSIVETSPADGGWNAHGKTGAAFPRNPDGTFDEARGYGWYVGWMKKGDRTLLFARLDQDERKERDAPGIRARAAFIKEWPALAATLLP
ncbi:class D beta-lactamase [Lichenifustis flavocetrariae]|uniref:beta-lactamase n=1 Tax=Lichenifustis flavocetrariae TaxID=2949735 RepID=A0AA42CMV9_9HYPH|nr:class D beta-lactamase [Lichenifustis flavocetrariae]MCW6508792.1 class D beta-lactamase [Lichenifustis flavocetrariae]